MKEYQQKPAPVRTVSEPHTVTIDALSDDGRGVTRIDGKVTFVDGALPGETVSARVLRKQRSYNQAITLEVLTPSPERIDPACHHFGVCGGCSLQHFDPAAQIRDKQAQLQTMLHKSGGVEAGEWLEPLTGPLWHYRRSARLGVRNVPKKGGVIVGFRERRSSYINPTRECHVLDERVARLLPDLPSLIEGLSCNRRIPQIEVVCGDDEAALIVRHLEPLTPADCEALVAFARARSIRLYLQPSGPESVTPLWPQTPGPLHYRLPEFDVTIRFVPSDFIQVNADINRRMVARAIELLAPGADDRVLDLFCGLGNFSLPLARRAGHVIGVESDQQLVDNARANAEYNAVANTEFRRVDLYDEQQAKDLLQSTPVDRMLLDPPRTGAIEVLNHLPRSGLPRIVYVSCNPATLARDAEILVNVAGYRLARAGVMDMFPHTNHVESIAVFER